MKTRYLVESQLVSCFRLKVLTEANHCWVFNNWAVTKNTGYLVYIGDEILPSYIGIVISRYKDPYRPLSMMEYHVRVQRCRCSTVLKLFNSAPTWVVIKSLFACFIQGNNKLPSQRQIILWEILQKKSKAANMFEKKVPLHKTTTTTTTRSSFFHVMFQLFLFFCCFFSPGSQPQPKRSGAPISPKKQDFSSSLRGACQLESLLMSLGSSKVELFMSALGLLERRKEIGAMFSSVCFFLIGGEG